MKPGTLENRDVHRPWVSKHALFQPRGCFLRPTRARCCRLCLGGGGLCFTTTPRGSHGVRGVSHCVRSKGYKLPTGPDVRVRGARQSVGKGCQKSVCPWALWLSDVICVFNDAFEAIYPLHHSGVAWGAWCFTLRPLNRPWATNFHSFPWYN